MKNIKIISVLSALSVYLAANIFAASFDSKKWRQEKSEHFIVYFKDVPEDFIKDVIEEAEDYYVEITQDMGFTRYNFWLWEDRAKFYIYNNKEDYIADTGQPSWSAAVVQHQAKIIRTYPRAAGFFDSTMPHELGHIIFREVIGSGARVPLWLEEGVASYQEKSKRMGADGIVRAAMEEGRFIPLAQLSRMDIRRSNDKEKVKLFYAEAVSAVNFLIVKFGKGRFASFCRDLEDGDSFEEGLWHFGAREDISKLNKKWVRFLER